MEHIKKHSSLSNISINKKYRQRKFCCNLYDISEWAKRVDRQLRVLAAQKK